MKIKIGLFLALVIAYPAFGSADDRMAAERDPSSRARMGEIKEDPRLRKMVDDVADVYASVTKGPNREIPAKILKETRCVAVLPSVVTGALVVGGTHGDGLAVCKDGNNEWSQPAPVSLSQGSLGLQAGAKSADLVLLFQSKEAADQLKKGKFSFGADISAVAGKYDSSLDTSTAGVVVYTRAEGLFAGASINGSSVQKEPGEITKYYGKGVDYAAILEGREMPDMAGYTKNFTNLLP